jgi:uncharacterized protein
MLAVLLLLTGGTASRFYGQQKTESPVFKSYRPPLPARLEPSNNAAEIFQAFLTARKANAGDAIAQLELGNRYMVARGVEADTIKAAYWFGMAAAQGVTVATYNLAILSYNGWGVQWNPFEAFRCFRICAEREMREAQHITGLFYSENLVVPRDDDRALYWVQKSAAAGYEPAIRSLRALERNAQARQSDTTSQSPFAAVQSVDSLDSADAPSSVLRGILRSGNREGMRLLGITQPMDSSVVGDSSHWASVLAAADAGSPEALILLGRSYEQGWRVQKDRIKAALSYLRAIRTDAPRAPSLLWALIQQEGFIHDMKSRARTQDADAQVVWVGALSIGAGALLLQQQAYLTESQALQMLRKGAESGHTIAMNELGLCYYAGRWTTADPARALEWWQRSRNAGNSEADIRLAMDAVRNSRDSLSVGAAVLLLDKAVQHGSILAQVALGYCAERGVGMKPSLPIAVDNYRSAASRGSQDAYRALRRMHDQVRPADAEFKMEE